MTQHLTLLFAFFSSLAILLATSELNVPELQFRQLDIRSLLTQRFEQRRSQKDLVQRNYLLLSGLRAELISGSTAHHALQYIVESQFANELSNTFVALETFSNVHNALLQDAQTSKFSGLEQLAVAWELSQETGAPLASLVEQIIFTFEEMEKRRALIHTETAGVKATVYVLAALPLIGMFLAAMLGINVITWFFTGLFGFGCLLAGVLLELAGIVWVRRMIAHANPLARKHT